MEEIPLNATRLLRVWWSFVWRFLVLNVALGLGMGLISAVVALAAGLNAAQLERSIWLQVVFLLLVCASFLLVLAWVFGLKWKGFRIALIRMENPAAPEA